MRALVLCPTRELAGQIEREFIRLSAGKKFGVCVLSKANTTKSNHIDTLISTPLRLVHLLKESEFTLDCVKILVMDEADRLFELGFLEQVDEILAACTAVDLQRCLFSATLPEGVENLARTILRDPIRVSIWCFNLFYSILMLYMNI